MNLINNSMFELPNDNLLDKIKGIKRLIKYFDRIFNITDVYTSIDPKSDVENKYLDSNKILVTFFEVVLDFYYKSGNIPIDYSSNIPFESKVSIIKKIYDIGFDEIYIKLFDLVEYMFKSIKNILIKTHDGFLRWKKGDESLNISFNYTIFYNIDLLFYITFYSVFPYELNTELHDRLKISDTEYRIIKKCNDIIIKDESKICNINFEKKSNFLEKLQIVSTETKKILIGDNENNSPSINVNKEYLSLNKYEGIRNLFYILMKLRSVNDRRKYKEYSY